MQEAWKDIVGFEGRYEASNFGRIRSFFYRGGKRKSPKILNPHPDKDGYLRVALCGANGERKQAAVHRVICIAFRGAPPVDKPEVDHRDRNRKNNRSSNLRWYSNLENIAARQAAGGMARGAAHGKAKLTEDSVRLLRRLRSDGLLHAEIAARLSVSPATISHILNGRTWSHVQ